MDIHLVLDTKLCLSVPSNMALYVAAQALESVIFRTDNKYIFSER